MTEERLHEIMDAVDSELHMLNGADNAFLGLQILSKYTPKLIESAGHDIIYSAEVDDVVENITEEDVTALAKLNWMVDKEYNCFACFV